MRRVQVVARFDLAERSARREVFRLDRPKQFPAAQRLLQQNITNHDF